jgi:anti-sigma factor RsiW
MARRLRLLDDLHRRYDGPLPAAERSEVLAAMVGPPALAKAVAQRTLESLVRSTAASLAANRLRRVRRGESAAAGERSFADDPILARLGGSLAEYRAMALRIRDAKP